MSNVPEVPFDRDRFVCVVHYIVDSRRSDLNSLGKTKLHKVLYYSDMLSFIDRGEPLTGVEYIKEPFGPTARYLGWALDRLVRDGSIEVRQRNYFGLQKFDFISKREFTSNMLGEYERSLIDEIIEFVCGFSAKEISEISHSTPWQRVALGERIPYSSAFLLLPSRKPSKREIEWAREQVLKSA